MKQMRGLRLAIAGAIIVLGLGGTAYVYRMHSRDYCFASGRFTTDREFYKAALLAVYRDDPFLVESNEKLVLRRPDGSYEAVRSARPANIVGRLERRISALLQSPQFERDCCSRAWAGEYAPPGFFNILFGTSTRGVLVKSTDLIVDPRNVAPRLVNTGGQFVSNDDRLTVIAGAGRKSAANIFVTPDTCGKLIAGR